MDYHQYQNGKLMINPLVTTIDNFLYQKTPEQRRRDRG